MQPSGWWAQRGGVGSLGVRRQRPGSPRDGKPGGLGEAEWTVCPSSRVSALEVLLIRLVVLDEHLLCAGQKGCG